MISILSVPGRNLMEEFARSRTLLVLDYDGTLSPIVRRQTKAQMSARTARLLKSVCELYPTAIVSGRSLRDVQMRLQGARVLDVVGNHGLEWRGSRGSVRHREKVSKWMKKLHHALETGEIPREGVELEDKNLSLSIHYRAARNHARVRELLEDCVRGLSGAHVVEGKYLLNLVPDARANKGSAILKLKRKLSCQKVIFVGDDVTDESVFALRPKTFLLDVRVGKLARSKARYFLSRQTDMNVFLEELIRLRR